MAVFRVEKNKGYTFEAVTAIFECAGQSFTARGKTVLSDGWKEIDRKYRTALKNNSSKLATCRISVSTAIFSLPFQLVPTFSA